MIALALFIALATVGWAFVITSWLDHGRTIKAWGETLDECDALQAEVETHTSGPGWLWLPEGLYLGANRYTTDDTETLHLWDHSGASYDLTWPKDTDALLSPAGSS